MKNFIFFFFFLLFFFNVSTLLAQKKEYAIDAYTSLEYTDNLYLTDDDEDSDVVSLFGATFSADRSTRISDLLFQYMIARSVYWDSSDDNAFRHTFDLSYFRSLSKHISLSTYHQYYRTEEPIERNEEVFREHKGRREPYYRYTGGLNLGYEFLKDFSLNLGLSINYLQNENPDDEDSRIYTEFLQIRKDFVKYFFSLGSTFTQREFETDPQVNTWGLNSSLGYKLAHNKDISLNLSFERTQEMGPDSEDYSAYQGNIQYSFSPTPDQRYWFSFGYYYRDEDNSSNEDKGYTFSINYSKRYLHTTVSLSGSGGYTYEYGDAENNGFTEYYLIGASLTHQFSRTLSGSIGGAYRIEDFKDEDRTDETYNFFAGLSKTLTPKLHLSASYNLRIADSDEEGESYTENTIMIELVYNFWRGHSLW